jgi:hypothetical protein
MHVHLELQHATDTDLPLGVILDLVFDRVAANSSSIFARGIQWSLYYGLDELFTFGKTTLSANVSTITFEWGPFFRGASFAKCRADSHGANGTIDGRAFAFSFEGYDSGCLDFDDGGYPPETHPPGGLPSLLPSLATHITQALNSCASSNKSLSLPLDQLSGSFALDRSQDFGHLSFPFEETPCVFCRDSVAVVEAAAVAGCVFSGIFALGASVLECIAGAGGLATIGLEA